MSSFNLLGLGSQAAQANQAALSVVGQNISNVNTPGYNRQVANLATWPEQRGVNVDSITRITDDFLTRQLWADTSVFNKTDIFADMSSQLDNLLATDSTSLSTAMDNYFKALQNAVDDPTSLPNRELFVAEMEALARRFNDLNGNVIRQNEAVNDSLESLTRQVSTIASEIANLNDKIRVEVAEGKTSNELRDQRDKLVADLSELIDVRVVEQDHDEFAVFVSNGEPLVVGISANQLTTTVGDPDASQHSVALIVAGNKVDITDRISGGKIGGLVEYRETVLNPTINELGRIAIGFSESMNELHQQGMDLEGNLGGLLFQDMNSSDIMSNRIAANSGNGSTVNSAYVNITNISTLTTSDYEITFNSSDELFVERLSDGKRFSLLDLNQVASPSELNGQTNAYYADFSQGMVNLAFDGIQVNLEVKGRFVGGDRFLVQPTRDAAAEFQTVVTDGRQLAFASPVRILASPDNTGTGAAEVNITDIDSTTFTSESGVITPSVEVVFNAGSPTTFTVYDITDPANPVPLELDGIGPLENQIYTPGEPIQLDGYKIIIKNQPAAGDRFTFEYNEDGVSDNRNALLMSGLQVKDLIDGGSFQDIYGSLIEEVGTQTSLSMINREASQSVLKSTQQSKSSLSGVNLDEEAAKLIQFQQAYQASAQLISTSQKLFDSLIGAI